MPVQPRFEHGDEVRLTDATFAHSLAVVPNRGYLVARNSLSIDPWAMTQENCQYDQPENGALRDCDSCCLVVVVVEAFEQGSFALDNEPYYSHTWECDSLP